VNHWDKLQTIIEERCVYNIHFANGGVAFQFYIGESQDDPDWRKDLTIYKYYPTIADAIDGEYERLTNGRTANGTTRLSIVADIT
jgi:hypothetical protein